MRRYTDGMAGGGGGGVIWPADPAAGPRYVAEPNPRINKKITLRKIRPIVKPTRS